ncbi:MAG: pyridoxamine 5'-phosphate oxidase [Cocleimonas sp.]|nr:pyridoxamine 5'-phosphate oxidase [Cocleimonas sp.]
MDLGDYRRDYTKGGLRRKELSESPFEQFEKWFLQADQAGVQDASAMSLATVSSKGVPSLRTVLLKTFDEQGFIFYTNYGSQKSQEIEQNSHVALLFPWTDLERQIEITGKAKKVSTADSLRYFLSRPKGSQLGAWASNQSATISSRNKLEMQLNTIKQKFKTGKIPIPDFWGGYRVVPEKIEFWQGGKARIHDRFEYQRTEAGWKVSRLQP